MIESKNKIIMACEKIMGPNLQINVTDEQAQLIIVEVFGRKITDDRYKVFKRIIQEFLAAQLLIDAIKETSILWASKRPFDLSIVKKLIDTCLEIYVNFPDFFYRIPIKIGPSQVTEKYLSALAYTKDLMVVKSYMAEHSLEIKVFNMLFDFDNGLDCINNSLKETDVIVIDALESRICIGDIDLEEDDRFEKNRDILIRSISNMAAWGKLDQNPNQSTFLEEYEEKIITTIFELYLDFFQHFSTSKIITEIISEDKQRLLIDNMEIMQRHYVNKKILRYQSIDDMDDLSNYTIDLALTRSKIQAFNWMFRDVAKLKERGFIELMFNNEWYDNLNVSKIYNARPGNIPKTHWWWFS